MPVIDKLSENVKLSSKFTPLDANQYGNMSVASQSTICSSALLPSTPPIPVLPIGAPISLILNKLEALPGEMAKKNSEIINQIQQQFIRQYTNSIASRQSAIKELYNNLKEKQQEIKEQIPINESEIVELKKDLKILEDDQQNEMNKYLALVFKYSEQAKYAITQSEQNMWIEKINDLNPWLEQILFMIINIVNIKVEIANKELDVEIKREQSMIVISRDWDAMIDIAIDFEVAVPYYPDIPESPSLPEIPKFVEEPAMIRTTRKQFAKWIISPIVPPIGILLSATLLSLTESVANTTQQASQKEAEADAMILKSGGAF